MTTLANQKVQQQWFWVCKICSHINQFGNGNCHVCNGTGIEKKCSTCNAFNNLILQSCNSCLNGKMIYNQKIDILNKKLNKNETDIKKKNIYLLKKYSTNTKLIKALEYSYICCHCDSDHNMSLFIGKELKKYTNSSSFICSECGNNVQNKIFFYCDHKDSYKFHDTSIIFCLDCVNYWLLEE